MEFYDISFRKLKVSNQSEAKGENFRVFDVFLSSIDLNIFFIIALFNRGKGEGIRALNF